jgi:hypothetical protein
MRGQLAEGVVLSKLVPQPTRTITNYPEEWESTEHLGLDSRRPDLEELTQQKRPYVQREAKQDSPETWPKPLRKYMKNTAISLFLLASLSCLAQTDNTFYAKQFPGSDVGSKVAAAQSACDPNTAIKCFIIIDPSLYLLTPGNLPAKCTQCTWFDFRTAKPEQVTPSDYGVVDSTGLLSSTAAFQAAINTGKQVVVPPGLYNVCGITIPASGLQLVGPANNRQREDDGGDLSKGPTAELICGSGDMFTTGAVAQIERFGVSGLKLTSKLGGGHIFDFGNTTIIVDAEFNNVNFNQQNPARSWIVGYGGVQELTMEHVFGFVAAGNTAPAVQIDGPINVVDIENLNIGAISTGSYSAHYLFELNKNSGGASNVHIHDSLCEQATAGCFNLNTVTNASIDNVINYDEPMTPTAPFITIGAGQYPITSFSGSSGTLIFQSTAGYQPGATPTLNNFAGANIGLNGQVVTVLPTGLSLTQFEAVVIGSGYSSGSGVSSTGSGQVELTSVYSSYGTASVPDLVCPAGVCEFHNTSLVYASLGGVVIGQLGSSHYLDYTPAQQTDAALMGVWSSEDGFSGGGMTGNLLTGSDGLSGGNWDPIAGGAGSTPVPVAGQPDPLGGTSAVQVTFAIGSGATYNDYSEYRQSVSPSSGVGTYTFSAWVKSCSGSARFAMYFPSGYTAPYAFTATSSWQRFHQTAYDSSATYTQPSIGLYGELTPAAGTQCLDIYGAQVTPGTAIHPYVSTTYARAALPIQPRQVINGQPALYSSQPLGTGAFATIANYAQASSCGTTTTCSNSPLTNSRIVIGSATLSGGTVTVSSMTAWTSTNTFNCMCTDTSTTAAACSIQNTSATSITIKGTSADTISYHCIGY